jgi:hypothetical protein
MLLKLECIDGYGIVSKKNYMWMCYDIFWLRIVMINGFCWNWNVLMVMELLIKINVIMLRNVVCVERKMFGNTCVVKCI